MSNRTRIDRRDEHTYVVVPKELYDDRGPADRLLDHIEERGLAPFSYEELKRRQCAVDEDQLAGTFGSLVQNDRLTPTIIEAEDYDGFAVAEREALADLRRYLDQEWGWDETTPRLPDDEAMDAVTDDADSYNSVMHFRLEENDAFTRQGVYTFLTDEAWTAIYAHTGETVWDLAGDDGE